MGIEEAKPKVDVKVNQEVKVISGPFENFVGKIVEVNQDRQKVKSFNFHVWS